MTTVELATCCVLEDPTSPVSVGAYVVACMAFYERGFSVPSHQFLCSLLRFYGLEPHHLTPLGILHITVFVTLCEDYMGIELHFDMSNHFIRVWLLSGSGTKAAVLGGVDIYVKSWHVFDPYFHLPMFGSTDRWGKVWFFLRNDVDASLPVFMGSCPVPQPNWGYGVARRDLRRLQQLCEVVQQL
jgi:hypothetical protein